MNNYDERFAFGRAVARLAGGRSALKTTIVGGKNRQGVNKFPYLNGKFTPDTKKALSWASVFYRVFSNQLFQLI
ncbi:hypothetical protein [Pseudomonas aeruginosa]|uniref:hypothetical protein n=1 Tax=Pseudomonas aeruginosa TaxID=287 RepID=UPI001F3A4181|nr:hypothetical protein [Pseudomonas aeruginosa]HEJ6524394.1 hypothetical protein [Pseudomonas aeruginosa]